MYRYVIGAMMKLQADIKTFEAALSRADAMEGSLRASPQQHSLVRRSKINPTHCRLCLNLPAPL